MFFGDSLISWKSKKQGMLSLSSAEVEYMAMCMATKQIIWLTQILKALRVPFSPPAQIYCDNTAAHIASKYVYHQRKNTHRV